MEDPNRLQVELVGAQLRVGDSELPQHVGEPLDARPNRTAQAQPNVARELRLEVVGRLAQERERTVEEGGIRDSVVGERFEAATEAFGGFRRRIVDGLKLCADLGQVARRGQGEQLLLGGEVAVDDGLVDPHAARDPVDPGVLHPALVEQGPGGVDDLTLTGATGKGTRTSGSSHAQTVTGRVTFVYMHTKLEHSSVRLHGREVAHVVGGEGPTILLIHGIGGDWRTWEPVLVGLAQAHHVVAVDLPGHGGSTKGAGDYSLGALANALRDLAGVLGIERATVVGHSLGGGVAMQFAYQFPERCERLVLVSSGGLGPDVGLILRLATLPGSELFLSLTAPAARSLVNVAASAGRALRVRAAVDAEFYARTYAALSDRETRAAFLGTLRGVVGARGQLVDARDRLYLAQHMPTLIVWGERDAMLPVEHAYAAQQAMTGSRLEIFNDAGHLPQLDDPARFVNVMEDFVASTEPSAFSAERWTELLRNHSAPLGVQP